jgi:hypothetical protein
MAEQRFDAALQKAVFVELVSAVVALMCIIATILFGLKTLNFIASFEYVEETNVEIEQDSGINTAVIGGENEVNVYGTENYSIDTPVLAQEAADTRSS